MKKQNKRPAMRFWQPEPIHAFFSLSYANYLCIPRSVLQSMPLTWQRKFVDLIEELDALIAWRRNGICVEIRDEKGRKKHDDLADYGRGGRRLPLNPEALAVPDYKNVKKRVAFLREYLTFFAPEVLKAIPEDEYYKIVNRLKQGSRR